MWTANEVYGGLPVPASPLVAPTTPGAVVPQSLAGRAGVGERLDGDPVLVWVALLGIAIALGWLSISVRVG